jgi:hypothetical protein
MRIHRSIFLPVVLYKCENWSLILRGEHRVMMFENRVLTIIREKFEAAGREIGWGGMDWSDLAQDFDQWKILVNTVIYLRVP